MMKLCLGLFFGGRSTEHEISVISALQAFENLDLQKYEVIPVYVSKLGDFYTSSKFLDLKNYQDIDLTLLSAQKINIGRKNGTGGFFTQGYFTKFTQLDLSLPLFHGSYGEDGCIQGLFEINQIPYTGFNVTGSAVAMDKVISKALFKSLGFNVAKGLAVNRSEWNEDQKKCLDVILGRNKVRTPESKADSGQARMTEAGLKYPLFVKPATAGSSIGTAKAENESELAFNLEVAFTYSEKVLVEQAFVGLKEVNCAVLGYGNNVTASVCEMPVSSGELLSFDDKYRKAGKGSKGAGMASLSRIIPAPIPEKLEKQIQQATIKIFKALDGCGVARIDYFVDKEKEMFWVNEVNSPPGSLSFYLFEPKGVKFSELLDRIIEAGLKRAEEAKKTTYVFPSGLLSAMAQKGGIKS